MEDRVCMIPRDFKQEETQTIMKRELGIACCLCSENDSCKGCKSDGFMDLSWSAIRRCGKGVYAEKIKPRAFAEFAQRYGIEELLDSLERNEQAGMVYHREGIMGDYDDLEELIDFIKTGKRNENRAKAVLETERLVLREMNMGDYDALHSILADPDNMQHYPYPFDERRIRDWIEKNMERYHKDGFGLWAVCLKDTGEMVGDCGLTMQNIDGEMLPEIGYHIRGDCQRKGYAKEVAAAVRDWAFENTDYPALYSYCKYTNEASIRTAEAIGMQFDREYPDETNGITHVSVIYRRE